jgi:hypothetical protein
MHFTSQASSSKSLESVSHGAGVWTPVSDPPGEHAAVVASPPPGLEPRRADYSAPEGSFQCGLHAIVDGLEAQFAAQQVSTDHGRADGTPEPGELPGGSRRLVS